MPPRGTGRPKRPAPSGRARPTQLPSGRWTIQVLLGTDAATGSRIRKRVSGDTADAARAARDALLARRTAGLLGPDPTADRQSVATLLRSWLENKDGTVAYSTWQRYQFAVERHLIPRLGRLAVGTLTPNEVRRAYRALQAPKPAGGGGLQPKTIRMAHLALRQALAQGVQDGVLARNVTDAVRPPAAVPKEARALTGEEAARLLAAVSPEGPWLPLWTLALYSGMRLGELLGLTWPDVDLAGARVTVRRALVKAAGGGYVLRPAPKSRAGVRIIPVPRLVVDRLQAHRRRQLEERVRAGPQWEDNDGQVFLSRTGTALNPANVIRSLKRAAVAAGIEGSVHPHVLRHTFASSLLAAGRPITEVSYLLGHSSASVTLGIYAHHLAGADPAAAAVLQRYYASFSEGAFSRGEN